ncbi:protein TolR [Sulfuriflexus sp.]|uniref:protein TolR n=1 Tax=Sulfuriflexus sp. TaxID=2015443 RepID=UPI0028CF18E9|nr:protein TolR [Sulfuriflexus sp.]MDT8404260.1 protein TolR [Sulfuriflexus sp.]
MGRRQRKKPISEINVVPYIDVMLVLLIIFMVTTPLLTQGVAVDLPQADANPVDSKNLEPLVITVDVDGNYYVSIGDDQDKPIDNEALVQRVAAVMQYKPGTPVLVRGDENVNYGKVVVAMTLIQQAGAPNVGLLTESPR